MKKVILLALTYMFGFLLFLLGIYYAWLQESYGQEIARYQVLSNGFGRASLVILSGSVLVSMQLMVKRYLRKRKAFLQSR